jgi:hypothetical protein
MYKLKLLEVDDKYIDCMTKQGAKPKDITYILELVLKKYTDEKLKEAL